MKKIQEAITKITINWGFLSRLLIGILFVYSGIGKIVNFNGAAFWLSQSLDISSGIAQSLILIAVLIEILLGANLIVGKFKKDLTLQILISYVILITIVIDYRLSTSFGAVLKNMAIVGGLIACMDSVHKNKVI